MNRIEELAFGPAKALSMAAGDYEAIIVPQLGANLISLKNNKKKVDISRTPENYEILAQNPVLYGIPVLFFPNRIDGGIIKRNGVDIRLPLNDSTGTKHIHGFLYNRAWKVKEYSCNADCNTDSNNTVFGNIIDCSNNVYCKCVFENHKGVDIYDYFPFDFTVVLTYKLSSNGLEQIFEIQNTGCREMPLGLGYHIAFKVPYSIEGNAENCHFRVSSGSKWEINDDFLPSGKILHEYAEKASLREKGMAACGNKLGKMSYIASPISLDNEMLAGSKSFHGAIIQDISCGDSIIFETDKKFGHWVIWNGDGNSGFVCIEPQTWAINAPNLNLDDDITGFQMLKPGCMFQCTNKIYTIAR